MGKFLTQYKEALERAKAENRQIRAGAVPVDSLGRYLILGRFMGQARGRDGELVDVMTHELPSGKVSEHQSLETATLRNVYRETGLNLSAEAILGYLDHFDYEFRFVRGPGKKTQFNFLVYAGVNPAVETKRGFSWAFPNEFTGNGYHLSPETKGILTLPKIEQILALRKQSA